MANFITETLDSILRQDYETLEIIVVNDGSTDSTADVVNPYLEKTRIQYIYQPNCGLPNARNTGIKAASGDAIMFVDADDILPEGAISNLANELIQLDEAYCLVHGEREGFDNQSGMSLGITNFKKVTKNRRKLINTRTNILLSCLIRKHFIEAVGMFHEEMKSSAEDIDLLVRLSKVGKFKGISQVVYKYRVHSNSKSYISTYEHSVSTTKERCSMLKRVLKGEDVFTKLESWGTHYFWAGVDFHKHDKNLGRKFFLISLLVYPFNTEPLKLLRASLLGKI